MYKVFVNDKPIILTTSLESKNTFPTFIFKNSVIEEVIYRLQNEKVKGINLYCENLTQDWVFFLEKFKVIPAAGGLVLNQKKEVLFIYRNNVWDLPKGRIEKGESIETAAIREVEEECGIFNLLLINKLITTYHIFYQKGYKIKETHWFVMSSNFDKKLTPQLEEGITKAVFINDVEAKKALKNSYGNIKLVYDTFKEA
jgi:hypothetical protein